MFIGYYSVANGVTLAGLLFSVLACFLAAKTGHVEYCVYLMFISFLCDIFDGRLARKKKNRSEAAKLFGIQLDSLCDLVSFGITPCFIAYFSGFNDPFDILLYCLVVVCGAIRLAYFNTMAIKYPEKTKQGYRGFPIPASMLAITIVFMLKAINLPEGALVVIFRLLFIVLAFGYVLNFRFKKKGLKSTIILIVIEIVMLLILFFNGISNGTTESADGDQIGNTSDVSGGDLSKDPSDTSIPDDTSNTSDSGDTGSQTSGDTNSDTSGNINENSDTSSIVSA